MANEIFEKPAKYQNLGCVESWTEQYDPNPYIKDSHQVTREILSAKYSDFPLRYVGADVSLDEAQKTLKSNETVEDKVISIFECKHCRLLFDKPIRFLIHFKWHSYNIRRELNHLKQLSKKSNRRLAKKITDSERPSPDDTSSVYSCEICNQNYHSKNSLKNHRARIHFSNPKQCEICQKVFQNSSYLKSHMITHTEEKKYMCEECPKSFKFLHSLIRHQPSHKEKTFSCEFCGKSFGSDLLLKIHRKTHEKIIKGTTFQCTYCAKGFYHAYSLLVHERTHRGEKPFQCSICNSCYGTNSSLQRHLKVSHSGIKPFECSVCKRSFQTAIIRDRHLSRQHHQVDDIRLPLPDAIQRIETKINNKNKKTLNINQMKRKKNKKEIRNTPKNEVSLHVRDPTASTSQNAPDIFHPSFRDGIELMQRRLHIVSSTSTQNDMTTSKLAETHGN